MSSNMPAERHHLWLALEACGDAIERDRAHRAQRLSEDDVGPRVTERLLVEMKGALAACARLAHMRVDLARRRAGRDRRSGHARKVEHRGREVVVVRHSDELVRRAERPDDLRRGGDERDDAHGR
jgi:hypothetical protein